jgi:geranylgeranyl diphosphate synthase type II
MDFIILAYIVTLNKSKKAMIQEFNTLRGLFQEYLEQQVFEDEPRGLYQPINYIMNLGGKRIRPIALLIGANIFSDHINNALPVAYAFEMFHNFTLAHDDVMDNAVIRRGKPAMHKAFSLNNAILSGDAMLIYAYKYIIEAIENESLRDKLLLLFSNTAIEICEGQQMDMDFEEMTEVELSTYLLMIKYKTAVLLAACLKAGALIGGAGEADADHLYAFGLNIGLAFQIRDDYLDLYADESEFGKKKGGDIIQKKKTYLYLKALELADDKIRRELVNIYNQEVGDEDEILKVSRVRGIFDQLEISKEALSLMEELTENAQDHLNAIDISSGRLTELKKLASLLLKRSF